MIPSFAETDIMSFEDQWVAVFEAQETRLLAHAPAAIQHVRKDALTQFAALGLPTTKQEAWKYTPLPQFLDTRFAPAPPTENLTREDVAPHLLPTLDAYVLVLENGQFRPALSRLDGLTGATVTGLETALQDHPDLVAAHFGQYADYKTDALTALNTAVAQDGVFIHVPADTVIEKPIFILSLNTTDQALINTRNLFIFEAHSEAQIITYTKSAGTTTCFTNHVSEVAIAQDAVADLTLVQAEGAEASQRTKTHIHQSGTSVVSMATITLDGRMVRNNLDVFVDAERCESNLWGLTLLNGTTHADHLTKIDHAQPNCESNELYKSILDDRATNVFNGQIYVHQDAQKINAFQENKTLLLTDTATSYAKPQLEIYADDVKCSHGATTGQLDADALFYLRARGLDETTARNLLMHAFARDVLDRLNSEALRDHLNKILRARFS